MSAAQWTLQRGGGLIVGVTVPAITTTASLLNWVRLDGNGAGECPAAALAKRKRGTVTPPNATAKERSRR